MPRKVDEDITRLHVNLYTSDLEWLRSVYGENVGMGSAIRTIIRNNIKRVQELVDAKKKAMTPLSDDEIEEVLQEASQHE